MSSAKYFNADTIHRSDCENNINFDVNVRSLSDFDSSPSVREFLEQERQCTGEDTDEFDFENIFEQINKLQYGTAHLNEKSNSTENIDEILFQAEKLVRQSSEDLKSERSASRSNSSVGKNTIKKHISTNNSVFISNSKTVVTKGSVQNKKWEGKADTIKLDEDKINMTTNLVTAYPSMSAQIPSNTEFDDVLMIPNSNRPFPLTSEQAPTVNPELDHVPMNSAPTNFDDSAAMTSQASSKNAKDPTFYDLKNSLNEMSGEKSPKKSPRRSPSSQDDARNMKIISALQEELKDTNERHCSIQMQHDNLVESCRLTKNMNDELSRDNKFLETKLYDKDGIIAKLRKELESSKLDRSQVELNEATMKQELAYLNDNKRNFLLQSSKDKMTIQDLQRQCKEMEGILSRKHPDSVSALIVASKHPASEHNTKILLEKRISFLENELKEQETKYQNALSAVHDKVNSMKCNYETHISDLENQVLTLQRINSELKEFTKPKATASAAVQTDKPAMSISAPTLVVKPSSAKSAKTQPAPVQSANSQLKEDSHSHLVATVRGLTAELSQKEKVIARLTRDLDDSKKLVMKLQKEACVKGVADKAIKKKPISKANTARSIRSSTEALNANVKNNKENEMKKSEQDAFNNSLKKDLATIQKDYEDLKNKRIQDLFALQTAHEKELMTLNAKALPLHDDVSTLNTTVELLRNQIKLMDEQMTAILMERDHYKHRADILNSKLNFSTECDSDRSMKTCAKGTEKDYDMLKIKVAELEKRYEGREIRLKTLVESLARLKDSQFSTPTLDSGHCTERVTQALPRTFLPY